jgi:alkylation response protein AidB-like acyl-CoA dehydrogenase
VRDQVTGELNTAAPDAIVGLARVILMKEVVVENAIRTVEKAVELAGGRSYFRKSPLERLARDVRAARFHPPSAPISYQMAGERLREARAASTVPA